MIGKSKYPTIEITAGKQLGKSIPLKKGEYSIGSHKDCRIRIAGEYVSELHAIIKKNDDGVWTLSNNSPNGTFVNQQQVDSISLDKKSTINIGVDNSLEFELNSKDQLQGEESGTDSKNTLKKNKKWIWIGVLVAGIYVPGFAYLMNMEKANVASEARPLLSLTDIEQASEASREFLIKYPSKLKENPGSNSEQSVTVGNFERLVLGIYADTSEKETLIDAMVDESKAHLAMAHRYVQMNLNRQAEKSLRSAMRVVPDHRYPVTALASRTLSAIKQRALP